MAGPVPAICFLLKRMKAWMPRTSLGMTTYSAASETTF
jgi:hypothetical protein